MLQAKQGSGRELVSSDVVEKRELHIQHLEEVEEGERKRERTRRRRAEDVVRDYYTGNSSGRRWDNTRKKTSGNSKDQHTRVYTPRNKRDRGSTRSLQS